MGRPQSARLFLVKTTVSTALDRTFTPIVWDSTPSVNTPSQYFTYPYTGGGIVTADRCFSIDVPGIYLIQCNINYATPGSGFTSKWYGVHLFKWNGTDFGSYRY